MKKRLRNTLACTLAFVMCFLCFSATSVSAANVPMHGSKQMGQVSIQFRGAFEGAESFYYFINLNGYTPQTISETISGDFTNEGIENAIRSGNYSEIEHRSTLIQAPTMYSLAANSAEDITNARNGSHGEVYLFHTYETSRSTNSVEYAILPPGNKPWQSICMVAVCQCVRYDMGTNFLKTTHKVSMDGQPIIEYTCQIIGGTSHISGIKVYDANFQTPAAARSTNSIEVVPTTSKIYVDGKPVELGAYLIDGNNYVKLRDIACVLSGSGAEFNVAWDQEKSLVNILPGNKYVKQGGELSELAAANATLSTSQVTTQMVGAFEKVSTEYFLPTAYNVGGNNFYKLRDIAHLAGFSVSWDATTNSVQITTQTQQN